MSLEYPFPEVPAPGTTIEVAPGIRWLSTPLPFQLDHAGNAAWLCSRHGAELWTTQGEYLTAHAVRTSSDRATATPSWFRSFRSLTAASSLSAGRTGQTFFAMGEAIAHLHYLYYAGRARRALGNDGIMRYATSG